MNHFIYIFLLFSTLTISAQSISGTIQDNNLPVSFANVMLYRSADTTLAKFTYSDDDGKFVFENVKNDIYYLQISYVGLQDYKSESFSFKSNDKNLGNISMNASGVNLDEVVVTASKPMMEVKPDKLVLNVAGSVLASGDDALSLLRKAPGVLVDNNENISLLGKSGLVI
ncbi:MAG TPA: carboxypeptidase-like regulatory domain-containing protein, partial [Saprospiraceae bacterium]|nr:carboxypeptidase-like regulatory domain-containing protein [Saprospiraceae bacterium]